MFRFAGASALAGVILFVTGDRASIENRLSAAEPVAARASLVAPANTAFAVHLYHELAKSEAGHNLFFSPYSMSTALAMTMEGARGETAAEMGKALGYPAVLQQPGDTARPWNLAPIHTEFSVLSRRLTGGARPDAPAIRAKIEKLRAELNKVNDQVHALERASKFDEARKLSHTAQAKADEINKLLPEIDQFELRIANALWGEKTYPFLPAYVAAMKKFYGASGIFETDFRHAAEAARGQINGWVEKQTNQRIKNLVPKGAVDENTRLVLTNAIYFKGEWKEVFETRSTMTEDFLLADGKKVPVPMMAQRYSKTPFGYAAFQGNGEVFNSPRTVTGSESEDKVPRYPDAAGFLLLEMPYKGDELSMVIVAPRSVDGLAALEKKLTPEALALWLDKLDRREVDVYLPRFKLESDYSLRPALEALGMKSAFVDPGKSDGANFTGMSTSPKPEDRLYISQVLHKAFVEVNEKGTEAAAATTVIAPAAAMLPETVPFTPIFRADRPFIFLIRDVKSGAVLFLGRVTNPTG